MHLSLCSCILKITGNKETMHPFPTCLHGWQFKVHFRHQESKISSIQLRCSKARIQGLEVGKVIRGEPWWLSLACSTKCSRELPCVSPRKRHRLDTGCLIWGWRERSVLVSVQTFLPAWQHCSRTLPPCCLYNSPEQFSKDSMNLTL